MPALAKLYFQHHYTSLQCHMILQKSICWFAAQERFLSMLKTVVLPNIFWWKPWNILRLTESSKELILTSFCYLSLSPPLLFPFILSLLKSTKSPLLFHSLCSSPGLLSTPQLIQCQPQFQPPASLPLYIELTSIYFNIYSIVIHCRTYILLV